MPPQMVQTGSLWKSITFLLNFRTVDTFKTLVDEVPLPFMFICYRNCQWYGSDDEARQEFLLRAGEVVLDRSIIFIYLMSCQTRRRLPGRKRLPAEI